MLRFGLMAYSKKASNATKVMSLSGQPDLMFQSRATQRRTYVRHASTVSPNHPFNHTLEKHYEDTTNTYMGSVKTWTELGKAEICIFQITTPAEHVKKDMFHVHNNEDDGLTVEKLTFFHDMNSVDTHAVGDGDITRSRCRARAAVPPTSTRS